MSELLPLFFAAVIGFTHAFEVDHLLAVSSIVTRRNTIASAVRDGFYWGLGHTSTILLIGLLMIGLKIGFSEGLFERFEAIVGGMLIVLGIHRLWKTAQQVRGENPPDTSAHRHNLAYGVGLVHGLAGSGALVLLVMTDIPQTFNAITYLLIFGLGSVAGMMLASGVFAFPFSQKIHALPIITRTLSALSAVLCVIFGVKIIVASF